MCQQGTEKLMEKQIRNKQTERHPRSEVFFGLDSSVWLVPVFSSNWCFWNRSVPFWLTHTHNYKTHTHTHTLVLLYLREPPLAHYNPLLTVRSLTTATGLPLTFVFTWTMLLQWNQIFNLQRPFIEVTIREKHIQVSVLNSNWSSQRYE